jgi:hypothetical protein
MESPEKTECQEARRQKQALVPYGTLDEMECRLRWAAIGLKRSKVKLSRINEVRDTLRDLLYLDRCPRSERATRFVSVPIATLEGVHERLVRARMGRNVNMVPKEGKDLEEVRLSIESILYKARSEGRG